jgi:ATP-dependent Lhr-like helicase
MLTTFSVANRHNFHPAVTAWFDATFLSPTEAQQQAWPLVRNRKTTLIAAPTGSGKTLTAFLAAVDALVCESSETVLPDETRVLYVSPLKALSNDIRVNLLNPLEGIDRELKALGLPPHGIRTAVRTGDTTQPERNAMRRRAPHILISTPESLYVLLGSDSGRAMLATVRTVIVDEIHAVAGSKRGSHLALSLERLDALCARAPVRIGLSATQKPLSAVAEFLAGVGRECAIVDVGHVRERDLGIELPPVPLEPIMSNQVWERVYDRLAELTLLHRTTLVFVNTRRMAERTARHLADRLGSKHVAAHHGSLAKEYRQDAEQRLKRGELRILIATSSLELGIDIGDVDLVCQMGSPRTIASFLQRVGRSGHQVGGLPKGRLFPTSRDDLIECAALLDCARRDELDALRIPVAPLDVMAQQIVAEVSNREWGEDELFDLIRRASPFATLERAQYNAVLRMLTEGYTGRQGVRGSYLHRDSVLSTLRSRRGSKLTAVTSGGTIPDNADFTVILEPQGFNVGTVHEDFASESLAGDVFQLGNTSYRIQRIEAGKVRVEDAHGAEPNLPFWLGEAPGRSDELSFGVSRLRGEIDRLLGEKDDGAEAIEHVADWLFEHLGLYDNAARQIAEYLATARAALTALPTRNTLVLERFFDESGGMQLVLHSPYGSRINRAWGLALRKRFCRTFNFELQAAATEDAIVLSLSEGHSFVLSEVWKYLRSSNAEHVLTQALLEAPLFNVRWRWNATTALILPRYSGGRKVAPQIQRMRSDDLLAAIFPDQAACLENIVGERELPSHPLVDQTVEDCLHEAMDSVGWLALLRRMEAGDVRLISRDLTSPSPLAMEVLSARPYAFLDDAPLEERRTLAVSSRRWSDPTSPDDLGALDAGAIEAVAGEAWPRAINSDEMHEALMSLAFITPKEAMANEGWSEWLAQLAASGRAAVFASADGSGPDAWIARERFSCLQAAYPNARTAPPMTMPNDLSANDAEAWTSDTALVEIMRARLSGFGPQSIADIAATLCMSENATLIGLTQLENEGYVIRGCFTPGSVAEEWCERHLLARIHRYTIKRLRREIEPVERQDFMRFLFEWQHLAEGSQLQGSDALPQILSQLEGYEAAAGSWESELLRLRMKDYSTTWLDELCRAGKIVWTRVGAPSSSASGPVRGTPLVLLPRRQLGLWHALPAVASEVEVSPRGVRVLDALHQNGAMFFDELLKDARQLPVELENTLGELVATGLVNADSFAGLRAMLLPAHKRAKFGKRGRRGAAPTMEEAGRWALVRRADAVTITERVSEINADMQEGVIEKNDNVVAVGAARKRVARQPVTRKPKTAPDILEHIAMTLLRRYGVMFWHMLERESSWLPSWRELLSVYHRLEARGEVRGGRFVAGLSGEQFALPEAIPLLREMRRRSHDGSFVCISAVDPLNLCGTLLAGAKVPALAANRVLFRDGVPVGTSVAGVFNYLPAHDPAERELIHSRLIAH